MKTREETAVSLFDNGLNCAQSVLSSFCEVLNLDRETALKISSGFGGGMGRKEEVCGAVTGGIMVIGSKYGGISPGDKENMETAYSKTRELMDHFTSVHTTYICRELINECDLTTREGQKAFREQDLKNRVCKKCITTVINKLEEILYIKN